MKKYLLVLPILVLLATGCGAQKEDNNQQTSTTPEVMTNNSVNSNQTAPPVRPQTSNASSKNTPPAEETTKPEPNLNTYTLAQVQSANSEANCWSIVSGNVYNLTAWIDKHPGGSRAILNMCGKDATSAFIKQHGGQQNAENALAQYKLGPLSQ